MLEDGDVYALPASRDSWPTTSDQMAFHLFWASLSLSFTKPVVSMVLILDTSARNRVRYAVSQLAHRL